jgi:NADH:ubiquinone oxidoreductase subunit 2 (subunit N)
MTSPAVQPAPAALAGDSPALTRPPLDRFARRVLRLPVDGPRASAADAQKAFQTSVLVAAVRCLLMYIVFPFVLPAIGVAKRVGPAIGLPISALAIVAIVMSIRRFWRADHSKRWHYTALGLTVIGMLVYLVGRDVVTLL